MKCKRFFCLAVLLASCLIIPCYAVWEISDPWIISGQWQYSVAEVAMATTYPSHTHASDGGCLMYGGIHLKPNDIHTYIPQFNGNFENITLDNGELGLSKGLYAYDIECATNDNVTIHIDRWFYQDVTEFIANAENESSLTFTVNGRNRGEPRGVQGATTWSYDTASTTVSLSVANYTTVTITWENLAAVQLEWYLDRIPMWLGIAGMILLVLSPCMLIYFGKQGEFQSAFLYTLMFFILGLGCLIGWLW